MSGYSHKRWNMVSPSSPSHIGRTSPRNRFSSLLSKYVLIVLSQHRGILTGIQPRLPPETVFSQPPGPTRLSRQGRQLPRKSHLITQPLHPSKTLVVLGRRIRRVQDDEVEVYHPESLVKGEILLSQPHGQEVFKGVTHLQRVFFEALHRDRVNG